MLFWRLPMTFTMIADVYKRQVQNGEGVTADRLCEIYYNLNKKYFGDDIVIDKEIELEWARIPHFYNPFYVYQYATGLSAAIALSKRIIEEGKPAVEDYMKFLKGGSSVSYTHLKWLNGNNNYD